MIIDNNSKAQEIAQSTVPSTNEGCLIPHGRMISQHLALLQRNGEKFHLRAFSDKQSGGGFNYEVENQLDALDWIESQQAQGKGIFIVVNPGGPKDADITKGVAIFCEWDDLLKEEQLQKRIDLGLPVPTFTVETQKSIHFYWVFEQPVTVEEWRSLQKDLLVFTQSDQTLTNPSRVLRLAGTWHQKTDTPFLCELKANNCWYSYEELRKVIPVAATTPPAVHAPNSKQGKSKRDRTQPKPDASKATNTVHLRDLLSFAPIAIGGRMC